MPRIVKTMQGKEIDIDAIAASNEMVPAVGNVRVNARGDELGPGGQIIRKREDILADYYAKNPRAIKEPVKKETKTKGE